jgi:streptogramin lyase
MAAIETDLGPCAIGELDGSVWVTNLNANTLTRIDGATSEADEGINVGTQPCAVVGDGEALWIGALGDQTLVRYDPAAGEVTDTLDVAGPVWDIQVGHGSVWVSVQVANTLLRIDPETREIIKTFAVGAQPSGLVITPSEVWLATSVGTVVRIDPATNERLPDIEIAGDPTWFAAGPDPSTVLLTLSNAESVVVLDTASAVVINSFPLRQHPRDPGFVGGNFWVTANGPNRVVVVDPVSGETVGEFAVPDANAIWTAEGLLGDGWVLDFSGSTVYRYDAESGL